jgi:hypothetical protein
MAALPCPAAARGQGQPREDDDSREDEDSRTRKTVVQGRRWPCNNDGAAVGTDGGGGDGDGGDGGGGDKGGIGAPAVGYSCNYNKYFIAQ